MFKNIQFRYVTSNNNFETPFLKPVVIHFAMTNFFAFVSRCVEGRGDHRGTAWNDAVLNQDRPDSKFRRRPNPSSIRAEEMEEEKETTTTTTTKKKKQCFWTWALASVIFRLVLIHFSRNLNLASRPEVSTPLTSLRRCIFFLFLYDSQTPAHRLLQLNLDLNSPFSLLHCSGGGLLAEAILNFSLCRSLQKFQINLIQIIHLI